MPPKRTRQSVRKAALVASGSRAVDTPEASTTNSTNTSTNTPIFSAENSVDEHQSPPTSDLEETNGDAGKKRPRARACTRNKPSGIKRVLEAVSDDEALDEEDEDEVEVEERPAKRRAVGRKFYVDVPATKFVKNKGKGKAVELPVNPPFAKDKGKAKAAPVPRGKGRTQAKAKDNGQEADTSDSQSESELVMDQDIDESDDSGSEFVASEVDELSSSADSSEDEALMLGAAVALSLQTTRVTSTTASSSKTQLVSANPKAVVKALKAERRVRRRTTKMAEDNHGDEDEEGIVEYNPDLELSLDEDDESLSSSEEEPLSTKSRKGAKGKAKAKAATEGEFPAWLRRRETVTERRKRRRAEGRQNHQEELALTKKLGRKLTNAEKTTIALYKHHEELKDVWGDLEANIPIHVPEKAEQPENLKLTLLPFQQESLSWMRKQEQGVWQGGMLADEMGMGKTIQVIALLVLDGSKPNLVVAPTVAIMQWRNEINAHTTGLDVLVWHGANRETNTKELKKYDVVLTTYAVLESCFRKQHTGFKRKGQMIKEESALHKIKWNRVILDEAHNIKERSTNTAKAAFELQANYRWCLSGTPLQNRVGELYSLIRFLGGDPFSYYFCKMCTCKSLHWKFSDKRTCDDCGHSPMQHTCLWNNEILTPIQKHGMAGPGKDAFKKLKILLDRMMLRRTKLQRADDLGLPPRTVIVRRDYFSPEEKELYLSLFSDAKRQFSSYIDQGTVLNNYSNIFSLLTRMRQMACHPDLVLRSKTNAGAFVLSDAGEGTVCRICNEFAEDAIPSKCRHIFDRECIKQYLESAVERQPACPVCHLPLTIDLEGPALELEETAPNARQGILGRLNLDSWRSSSKIEALVEELSNLRLKDATTKSLVFSQFVNFLDLIAYRLQKAGFNICRLEGTMSPQARDATIKYFMDNVHVTVFLVSLKAGGVALNLTEASRVYLMDSWWNPAVEFQAMDRIHRLGQRRPVQAIKLVVEDSIESRIVQLQEKKSAMVDATLSTDDSAMGRLTPEDLGFLFRL